MISSYFYNANDAFAYPIAKHWIFLRMKGQGMSPKHFNRAVFKIHFKICIWGPARHYSECVFVDVRIAHFPFRERFFSERETGNLNILLQMQTQSNDELDPKYIFKIKKK